MLIDLTFFEFRRISPNVKNGAVDHFRHRFFLGSLNSCSIELKTDGPRGQKNL